MARAAHGREKTLIEQDRLPLPISCALDGLARHRAAGEPLDRVMAGIARERHLGPRERRATADLAFTWARHATAVEGYITKALKREGGVVPRRRQLDLAGLCLAGLATGHDVDVRAIEGLPPFLADLVEEAAATGLDLPVGIPAWLHQRLDAEHGADVVAALGRPGRPDLAVDVRRASVADVVAGLVAVGVPAEASPACATTVGVPVGALALHRLPPRLRKSVWPMDEGSQRVAAAMSAQPGERLLDLCAGGGGKSRVLAGTGAVVVAADVDAGRLRRSVPDGVIGVVADGLRTPFAPSSFDRVLVDAPCSGTGTLRRAPDLALRLDVAEIPALQETQRALLRSALQLVKPGGRVVYATCSLLRDENQDVVDDVVGAGLARRASADQTLVPPDSDGFFIAVLERPT